MQSDTLRPPATPDQAELTRVLVVDDEPNISALLSATLRLVGFDVRVAESGHAALAAAAEFDPDLVVLDVMLPDLDGFEVARRLRAAGHDVPVLFLTARDAVEDRISGLTAGADDYVTKPFSLEEVVLRIRAILRRSRPEPGADGRRRAALRRPGDGRGRPRGTPGGPAGRPVADRVQPAALPADQRRPGGQQGADPGPGVEATTSAATAGSSSRTCTTCAARSTAPDPPLIHTVRGVGYALRLPRSGEE